MHERLLLWHVGDKCHRLDDRGHLIGLTCFTVVVSGGILLGLRGIGIRISAVGLLSGIRCILRRIRICAVRCGGV